MVGGDDARGATVIYRENEIYYDVGVRLKGSQRGRHSNIRVGWHLRFPPHDAFLGAHTTMTIDRSGAGDQFSQKEILVIHALNRAGNIPGSYDDLVRVIAPRSVHTGSAMMQKARFSDVFLDGQWENGADGPPNSTLLTNGPSKESWVSMPSGVRAVSSCPVVSS